MSVQRYQGLGSAFQVSLRFAVVCLGYQSATEKNCNPSSSASLYFSTCRLALAGQGRIASTEENSLSRVERQLLLDHLSGGTPIYTLTTRGSVQNSRYPTGWIHTAERSSSDPYQTANNFTLNRETASAICRFTQGATPFDFLGWDPPKVL